MSKEMVILDKLRFAEKIDQDELSFIMKVIHSPGPDSDLHSALRAFALASPPDEANIDIVAGFLKSKDDWILQGVFYALCSYWNLSARFEKELLYYAEIGLWKNYTSAAIVAIGALGRLLLSTQDPALYRKLLKLYDADMKWIAQKSLKASKQHAELLHEALAEAVLGPDVRRKLKFPGSKDDEILTTARAAAAKKKKS